MCGYVGYIKNPSKKPANSLDIKEMNSVIFHRGPDSDGYYQDEHVSLAFRRLSIIDIEHGHQPLSYDDENYWMVFNGEIYNYVELREFLISKGHSFKSHSDTEILLALYVEEKERALTRLRGMFSFIIWDKKEQTLFGARDYFGIKPLYYLQQKDQTLFASEKKSLLVAREGISLNKQALQHYLSYQYVPEPETMDRNIKKLPPGHYFIKKLNQSLRIKPYWQPRFSLTSKAEEAYVDEIRNALRESVNLHMRSDVPVGAFLSGGIDSTLITSIAKEVHPNLKTFSVGFEAEGYSELDVAKETADKLGIENISYTVKADEFVEELPKIVWHLDDPLADPAAIPLYFVAREARKHVTVVLSGEGADELFGGYNIYREPSALQVFNILPEPLHTALRKISYLIPNGIKGKSFIERGTTPLQQRYIGNARIFNEKEKKPLIQSYKESVKYTDITAPYYKQAQDYDPVSQMQFIDIHTWLRGDILLKADKMTMANSLELKVPFLDKKVFEVASRIPSDMKIANKTTKYILRKAAEGIVPDHVLQRRKLGFPVPIRKWLKDELYDWALDLIQDSSTDYLFHKQEILNLLEQHVTGKVDNSRKIWTVLMFLLWHEVFIEEVYDLASAYSSENRRLVLV